MQENNDFHHDDIHDDTKEIEISDLPGAEDSIPPVKRISLQARYSFQQRRRQVIITTGVVLLALLALLGSLPQIQQLIASRVSGASDTATAPSSDYFYFQNLPSWGTFFFDGKPLMHMPALNDDPPVRLPAGKHVLEWRATPFQTMSCTLLVPSDPEQQTCTVRFSGSNAYVRSASLVSFPQTLSLNQLTSSQRAALLKAAQSLLDTLQSSTTVQPGEFYTYNQGMQPRQATKPLTARVRFVLDSDTSRPAQCNGLRFGPACSYAGNDCRSFCTLPWPQASDAVNAGWHAAAIVRPTWTYTDAAGRVIAPPQGVDASGDQQFVMLHITWQAGQWHVTFHPQGTSSFDDPNCLSTMGSIMTKPAYNSTPQQRVIWTFSSISNRSTGCLATATLHDGDNLQVAPAQTSAAYVLQRFGVLMAANDTAHRLWPNLPLADDYARNVARDIVQNAVFVS